MRQAFSLVAKFERPAPSQAPVSTVLRASASVDTGACEGAGLSNLATRGATVLCLAGFSRSVAFLTLSELIMEFDIHTSSSVVAADLVSVFDDVKHSTITAANSGPSIWPREDAISSRFGSRAAMLARNSKTPASPPALVGENDVRK